MIKLFWKPDLPKKLFKLFIITSPMVPYLLRLWIKRICRRIRKIRRGLSRNFQNSIMQLRQRSWSLWKRKSQEVPIVQNLSSTTHSFHWLRRRSHRQRHFEQICPIFAIERNLSYLNKFGYFYQRVPLCP